jgi:suppressor for copper-sensitivity B
MRELFHGLAAVAAIAAGGLCPGAGVRAWANEAASPWAGPDVGQVRLIAARDGAEGPLDIGVQIRLLPGWKTYWRSPGDGGLPPEFDWAGSSELGAIAISWPAPRRQDDAGLQSYVYADEVVFPVRINPPMGRPLRLRLKLSFGVCKDICIPADAELALDLPAGKGHPTPFAEFIARYAARVPRPAAAAGVQFKSVRFAAPDTLAIEAESATPFASPDLFVEGPSPFWFGKPQVVMTPGGVGASFRVPVGGARDMSGLAAAALTLTLVDGARAVEEQRVVGR